MNKKILLLIILILCAGLLVGFGKKTVELLNDKPLINLDLAIHDAEVGNEGSEGEEETALAEEDKEETSKTQQIVVETQVIQPRTYKVSVRSTNIKYDGAICKDVEDLKSRIIKDYKNGDKVILIDDYAESHVYRDVLSILDELKQNMNLEYGEQ